MPDAFSALERPAQLDHLFATGIIAVYLTIGTGEPDDPRRTVLQLYTLDGTLICEMPEPNGIVLRPLVNWNS